MPAPRGEPMFSGLRFSVQKAILRLGLAAYKARNTTPKNKWNNSLFDPFTVGSNQIYYTLTKYFFQ